MRVIWREIEQRMNKGSERMQRDGRSRYTVTQILLPGNTGGGGCYCHAAGCCRTTAQDEEIQGTNMS